MSANDFITGRCLALPTCQFCYWPNRARRQSGFPTFISCQRQDANVLPERRQSHQGDKLCDVSTVPLVARWPVFLARGSDADGEPHYHQPIMLKIRLAWLWWRRVWPVLSWLRVIWLVDLTCERHERHQREFCKRSFKITELEKGRWLWISNCGEAFHTDSWLAEANPGHSDRDVILQALLPGPSTVVLFGPGKARMATDRVTLSIAMTFVKSWLRARQLYNRRSLRL